MISAPAFVSALNSVVLPALGSPTMPTSSATAAKGSRERRTRDALQAEADAGVPREPLQVRDPAEHDAVRPSSVSS